MTTLARRRRRDRARGRSIHFRVTVVATAMVLGALAAAGTILVVIERAQLTQNLRDAVEQRADDLEALLDAGHAPDVVSGGGEDTLAQLVDSNGVVVAASPALASAPPVALGARGNTTIRLGGPRTDRFLVHSRPVSTASGPMVLHVAGSLSDIDDATRLLATSLTVGIPALAGLLAFLVWWLVGRTLQPVESIRAEVAAIDGSDLLRRVRVPDGDDEIARLADTMNRMLDRIERSRTREHRFVADASHELRTPLTRMRTELEVDLASRADIDLRRTCISVYEEAVQLQSLVDDLLLLARSSADEPLAVLGAVDLKAIVLDEVTRQRRGNPGTVFETDDVTTSILVGDRVGLARVVANLLSNAGRHAYERVSVALRTVDRAVVLTVTDDGPGIPETQHESVFERFTRLDDARARDTGGTGLGLAIVREVVERHHGSVVVDANHRHGARFVVTLPVGALEPPSC